MAKRKVDACDNTLDLEKKKFRIDEDDKNCVSVATCDKEGNELLQEIVGNWDCIVTEYPDNRTEVFKYYLGDPAVLMKTTTVVYIDADKCTIESIKRVASGT